MLYRFELAEPGRVAFAQRLLQSEVASATQRREAPFASFGTPPLLDPARGVVVNVGSILGRTSQLVVFEHEPGAHSRRVVGRITRKRAPYVHSFGSTDDAAVLLVHPFDMNPLTMLWSRPFVEHFRWRPQEGTLLFTIDRPAAPCATMPSSPCSCFTPSTPLPTATR